MSELTDLLLHHSLGILNIYSPKQHCWQLSVTGIKTPHSYFSRLSPWQLNELQKSQNQLQSEQEQNSPGSKSTSDNCKEEMRDQQQGDDRVSERLRSLQTAHDALRLPVGHMTQNISPGVVFIRHRSVESW